MNKTFILLGLLFITVPILADINVCPAFTDSTCKTCRRIANCTSCGTVDGYEVCTDCDYDLYPNALSSACVNCEQATGEAKCSACQYDKSLVRTKCTACKDEYGINTLNQCVSCSIKDCESCKVDDKGNSTCDTCKVGSVKSSDSKTCNACPLNCDVCTDANTCTVCSKYTHYLKEKVCVECSKLTDNCAECTNTQCEQCASGYELSSNHTCFKAIDNCDYYETANGTCKTCYYNFVLSTDKTQCTPVDVPNCLYYTTNTNNCTRCNTTYYLIPATTTPVAAASCGKCIDNCRYCDNATTCNYCDEEFFYDATAKKCTQCTTNCDQCSKLATCEFCAEGYYGDGTSTCTQCPTSLANCATCSNATTCTSCKDGFWKDGKTCLAKNISNCVLQSAAAKCSECDTEYLPSLNRDACVACGNVIPGCADCYWNKDYNNNALICYTCKSGYTLVNQVCVPCPFGCSNCTITTVNSANTILADEGLVLADVTNQYSAYTQAISCQVCASGYTAQNSNSNQVYCAKSSSSYLLFALVQLILVAFLLF